MPSYSAKSGQAIVAGKFLDSPNYGQIMTVNRNGLSNVRYDSPPYLRPEHGYNGGASADAAAAYSWGGTVPCPDYGPDGGFAVIGGGHSSSVALIAQVFDNSNFRYKQIGVVKNIRSDLAWAGYSQSNSNLPTPRSAYTVGSDLRDKSWYDYPNNDGSGVIKLLDHTYNTLQFIPHKWGGGVLGSILIPQSPSQQIPGPEKIFAPHLFSLFDGTTTRAMSAPPGVLFPDDNQTVSVMDTKRGNVWYIKHTSSTWYRLDLSAGLPYTFSSHQIQRVAGGVTQTATPGYAAAWTYCEDPDAFVCVRTGSASANAVADLLMYDMSTGFPRDFARVGLPSTIFAHGGYGLSIAWHPTEKAIYCYEGFGDEFCTVGRPSTKNFATCSWSWSRERFSGDAPITNYPGVLVGASTAIQGSYRGFHYIPRGKYAGCFSWNNGPGPSAKSADGIVHDSPVQFWRPPGKVF